MILQGIASQRSRVLAFLAALSATAIATPPADATFHLVNVGEVYTNPQGDVQFVELKSLFAGQTQMQNGRVVSHNADSTVVVILKDFVATYAWTEGQTMLLATAAFQDSAGFPPDFVIPNNVVFPSGRICFDRDPPLTPVHVDAVAYGNYTASNTGFGTPAPALPSDGAFSMTRVIFGTVGQNNATNWAVIGNTPKRTDGTTTRLHFPASGVTPGVGPGPIVLAQSRPNPMSEDAVIAFSLEKDEDVALRIYGVDGRLVREMRAGRLGAGPNQIRWDGLDANGRRAAGGVYVYRLTAGAASAARRLQVVR